MIHPIGFVLHLSTATAHQCLLARIALNTLYDSDAYPVDLSELARLDRYGRLMVRGFLDWCRTDPHEFSSWEEHAVARLKKLAAPAQAEDVDHD